jgi:hypothetical protein
MKFPFDFSISLIFRLIFPGAVIAIAALPFALGLLKWLAIDASLSTVFPISAVVFGWLVVLSDQPIYMLMEGRRYSPPFLRRWFTHLQAWRLKRIIRKYAELRAKGKDISATEVNLKKLDYPIGEDGEYFAQWPTRLGNLIAAFEGYPNAAYKLDSIFYWYRLWIVLDKDLRVALDETQAIADSAVYVSFSLFVAFKILVLYALGGWLIPHLPVRLFNLPYLPAPQWTLCMSVIPLVLSYIVYRVALFAQRGYGELYKSLFDQFRDKLTFVNDVAKSVVVLGGDPREAAEAKFRVTSRWLRWHKIRPPGHSNITPEAWAAQQHANPHTPITP